MTDVLLGQSYYLRFDPKLFAAMQPYPPLGTLYAAAYQRRRHVYTLVDGGPESALYKSTDAGATWNKLRTGLPASEMGRIGICISPVDTNVIYATIEAADRKGGAAVGEVHGLLVIGDRLCDALLEADRCLEGQIADECGQDADRQ